MVVWSLMIRGGFCCLIEWSLVMERSLMIYRSLCGLVRSLQVDFVRSLRLVSPQLVVRRYSGGGQDIMGI